MFTTFAIIIHMSITGFVCENGSSITFRIKIDWWWWTSTQIQISMGTSMYFPQLSSSRSVRRFLGQPWIAFGYIRWTLFGHIANKAISKLSVSKLEILSLHSGSSKCDDEREYSIDQVTQGQACSLGMLCCIHHCYIREHNLWMKATGTVILMLLAHHNVLGLY